MAVLVGSSGADIPGVRNDIVGVWMNRGSWEELALARWISFNPDLQRFMANGGTDRAVDIGVPLIPHDMQWELNPLLDEAASGSRDQVYRDMGKNLALASPKTAYLRVYWEFNMSPDPANRLDRTKFINAWRRAIPLIRQGFASGARSGQTCKIVWCALSDGAPKMEFWPGPEYVDIVGVDAYGSKWSPSMPTAAELTSWVAAQLKEIADIGRAQNKPIAMGEWSNWSSHPEQADGVYGSRGRDDFPAYIDQVFDWAVDPNNRCEYLCYYNISALGTDQVITDTPNSLARYQARTQAIQGSTSTPAPNTSPPLVNAGADISTVQNKAITLTATESGSVVVNREWKVISGPIAVNTVLSTGITAGWNATTVGTYVVRYTGSNSYGSSSDELTITVTPASAAPASPAPTGTGATLFTTDGTGTNGATVPETVLALGTNPSLGGGAVYQDGTIRLVTGNSGGYAGGDSISRRLPIADVADVDVVFDYQYTGDANRFIAIRSNKTTSDPGGGLAYALQLNGATGLRRFNVYNDVVLGSATVSTTTGTWYTARMRMLGSQVSAKIWVKGATEPTTWNAGDYLDTNITAAGSVSFVSAGSGAPNTYLALDNITARAATSGTAAPLPVVDAGVDRSTVKGTAITLTANESGGAATSREWRVLSGPAFVGTVVSEGTVLTWGASTSGTFVVRYTAFNATGSASDDVTITVTEPAATVALPVVNAGADRTTVQGTAITLTATESGGAPTTREWKIVAGPSLIGTVISTGATANWSGSTAGTFTVRYTATNSAGSATDDVVVTTTSTAVTLSPPTNFQATAVSTARINLTWTAAANATGYDIERDNVVIATGITGTSYADTGLPAGSSHTYRIRTVG